MDIFLQQKDIKTETLMPMTTSCGLPKLWLNTLFAILLCNKLWATMLWSCMISTRKELLFASNIPSCGIYNMGQTRQSPVQKQIIKNSSTASSTFISRQILRIGQTAIPVLKITVFPVKLWTPKEISRMFIVLRLIRHGVKLQKITDKPQQGSVTTWYETTSWPFLLREIFNFSFVSLWKSYFFTANQH